MRKSHVNDVPRCRPRTARPVLNRRLETTFELDDGDISSSLLLSTFNSGLLSPVFHLSFTRRDEGPGVHNDNSAAAVHLTSAAQHQLMILLCINLQQTMICRPCITHAAPADESALHACRASMTFLSKCANSNGRGGPHGSMRHATPPGVRPQHRSALVFLSRGLATLILAH